MFNDVSMELKELYDNVEKCYVYRLTINGRETNKILAERPLDKALVLKHEKNQVIFDYFFKREKP